MRRFSWTGCTGLVCALAVCALAACGDSKQAPSTGEQRGGSTTQTQSADGGGDTTQDCPDGDCDVPPVDPCATVSCAKGTRCELDTRACKDAPCPATAVCVPVQKEASGCDPLSCGASSMCVEDATGRGQCVPVEVKPISCGPSVCAASEECCDADCGLCAPAGSCAGKSCAVDSSSCDLKCAPGQHCARLETQCAAPPCPTKAECVIDGACTGPIIDCAAPPPDCNYVGGGCVDGQWTCGELVCAKPNACDLTCDAGKHCELVPVQCFVAPCPERPKCVDDVACTGPIIDCAAPPQDCNYVGGGCVAGKWTCGELACAPPEQCDPACEPGQRCIEKEVHCFLAPCPPLYQCVAADDP